MVAYNFQAWKAPKVESGESRQTIRAWGKRRHAVPGELLQLYTGLRTKACRKLINPDPPCILASPVFMRNFGGIVLINVEGKLVTGAEQLAIDDGFYTLGDFIKFFRKTHGFPFEGILIKW